MTFKINLVHPEGNNSTNIIAKFEWNGLIVFEFEIWKMQVLEKPSQSFDNW